jgi:hypothetical protein
MSRVLKVEEQSLFSNSESQQTSIPPSQTPKETEIHVHITRVNETPSNTKLTRTNHSILLVGSSEKLFLYRRFSYVFNLKSRENDF